MVIILAKELLLQNYVLIYLKNLLLFILGGQKNEKDKFGGFNGCDDDVYGGACRAGNNL
jgi:hypothetical protein